MVNEMKHIILATIIQSQPITMEMNIIDQKRLANDYPSKEKCEEAKPRIENYHRSLNLLKPGYNIIFSCITEKAYENGK